MATVGKLDSYFTSIIQDQMLLERQPLQQLQQQRDTVTLMSNAYSDLDSMLGKLQSSVKLLLSTNANTALVAGRTVEIVPETSGTNVFTASASSSALEGVYNIAVTSLAKEHRVRSDQQNYADQALQISGDMILGGDANRSVRDSLNTGGNVVTNGFGAAGSLDEDQEELATGRYSVETRKDPEDSTKYQFRLVDADGNSVSIRQGTGEEYSAGWQPIPAGIYDTGRGLTVTFAGSGYTVTSGTSAASVEYRAKGVTVTVNATDSLNEIASKINNATYIEGNKISATVVNRQLVLAAENTGSSRSILASGSPLTALGILGADNQAGAEDTGPADGFKHTLQTGANASLAINGITAAPSQNTGVSNLISGVTLNLASDAEGKEAALTISRSWTGARSAIDSFISNFNNVASYLEAKTEVSSSGTGADKTYTRGVLAGDTIFSDLRGNLFSMMMSDYSTGTGQVYNSLREIGISLDDNLVATVSDSSRLEESLNKHPNEVAALMDKAMQAFNTTLGRFTGNSSDKGYLDSASSSFKTQLNDIDIEIGDMNESLTARENYLVDQYAQIQTLLLTMSYDQQAWAGIYGSVSKIM